MVNFDPQHNYYDYLQTEHWQSVRNEALSRAGYVCENCGVSDNDYYMECHHISYKNKWNEQPEDLIILCGDCHENRHSHGTDIERNYVGTTNSETNIIGAWIQLIMTFGLMLFFASLFPWCFGIF